MPTIGLLAEEVDGATGELLGNFPQALSHVGLVNAAWAITQAQAGRAAPAPRRCGEAKPERLRGRIGSAAVSHHGRAAVSAS